jgi:hypothetical protein
MSSPRSILRLALGLALVALLAPATASPASAIEPNVQWSCTFVVNPVGAGFLVTMTGQASVFSDDTVPLPAFPVTVACGVNDVVAYSSPGIGVAVLQPTFVAATAPLLGCEWVWALLPDGTWIHYQRCQPLGG